MARMTFESIDITQQTTYNDGTMFFDVSTVGLKINGVYYGTVDTLTREPRPEVPRVFAFKVWRDGSVFLDRRDDFYGAPLTDSACEQLSAYVKAHAPAARLMIDVEERIEARREHLLKMMEFELRNFRDSLEAGAVREAATVKAFNERM